MKIHKVGFIGLGGRGRMLMRCVQLGAAESGRAGYHQIPGSKPPIQWQAEIVAAADPHADSREKARPLLPEECPIYEDPRRVLEHPEVEVVFVLTSSMVHAEWSIAAMEAGKDVICEKPMEISVEACDSIIRAVEQTGQVFGLSMQNRYSFWAEKMNRLAREGELGDVKMMWCHEFRCPFGIKVDDYVRYVDKTGGPFVEKNSHHWDLFSWWAQSFAVRVSACTQVVWPEQTGDIWDCGWTNVEYANGAIANLGLSFITPFGHLLQMGLIGTEGWAVSERTPDGGTVKFQDNLSPSEQVYRANLPESMRIGHVGAEIPMLNHLFDCIERRVQPDTNAWWGRESILIGLAAELSAKESRWVEVDELRQTSRYPAPFPSNSKVSL